MNKNVVSLLWKVTELTVIAVAEKVADKTVQVFDKKSEKKISK